MTGFIILDKPEGITSFIGGAIVRRVTGEKKTGHTGTLDPMATGVLPVAVGNATRFIELLPSHDKGYRASFRTGMTTDTLDITGTVLTTSDIIPDESAVREVISSFIGDITQIPPMYSAIQVNGQRLYHLARQGVEVERKARDITVFSIDVESIEMPYIKINVHCSKGTYIRTLAADIGDALGCGACISALERTSSGLFSIENAITPEELLDLSEKGEVEKAILPLDCFFKNYEAIRLDKKRADRVKNGVPIYYRGKVQGDFYRIYDENGNFIALSQADITDGRECLKLIKGFYK